MNQEERDIRLFEYWQGESLSSEEMREVIVLHYFQDMKLRDMAAVLKISLPLVKYRLSRAKKQLEALLREEEEA